MAVLKFLVIILAGFSYIESTPKLSSSSRVNDKVLEFQFCGNYNQNVTQDDELPPVSEEFIKYFKPLNLRWKNATLNCKSAESSILHATLPGNKISTLTASSKTKNIGLKLTDQAEQNIIIIDSDGSMKTGSGTALYTPSEYCINNLNGSKIEITICNKNEVKNDWCVQQPCIRKCCQFGDIWDISDAICKKLDSPGTWKPTFYNLSDDSDCVSKIQPENILYENMHFQYGLPDKCSLSEDRNTIPSRNIPPDFALGRFRMLMNSSVLMNYDNGTWLALSDGTFCIDEITMTRSSTNSNGNSTLYKLHLTQVLLVCKKEYMIKETKRRIPLKYASMLIIAALILFTTAIVYLILWDRHNVYEWTVFFEVVSMLLMIICVATSHSVARDATEGYLGTKRCILLGVVSHYFFLATFFWLFVINFEIWWNFRTLTVKHTKSRKWLRLFNYQLLAWGCPGVIVVVGLLLDKKYGLQNDEIDCTSIIIPNYGQLNCYISKRAQGPLLYFPIGVLLGFNLLFYTLTVFKMCEYRKSSQIIAQSKTNGQFQPIVVFARLFIVMGVSWVFEIIAWAVSPREKGIVPLYWVVFDIVTLLQAIAIFVIFVCRKEIIMKLMEKYPFLKPYISPLTKLPCCSQSKMPPAATAAVISRSIRQKLDLGDHIISTETSMSTQL